MNWLHLLFAPFSLSDSFNSSLFPALSFCAWCCCSSVSVARIPSHSSAWLFSFHSLLCFPFSFASLSFAFLFFPLFFFHLLCLALVGFFSFHFPCLNALLCHDIALYGFDFSLHFFFFLCFSTVFFNCFIFLCFWVFLFCFVCLCCIVLLWMSLLCFAFFFFSLIFLLKNLKMPSMLIWMSLVFFAFFSPYFSLLHFSLCFPLFSSFSHFFFAFLSSH